MSRLPIVIQRRLKEPLNSKAIKDSAEEMRIMAEADVCQLIYEFDYFTWKIAPESRLPGVLDHKIIFDGTKTENDFKFRLSVETIGTSLCPCSKEISEFGAHNQKCYVTIQVQPKSEKTVWIEDLIDVADNSVSCEIFSILKRPDEKWVTETAYRKARFVEDIARESYSLLSKKTDIDWFRVKVASDESIHVHRAEAIIQSDEI